MGKQVPRGMQNLTMTAWVTLPYVTLCIWGGGGGGDQGGCNAADAKLSRPYLHPVLTSSCGPSSYRAAADGNTP